MEDPKQTLEDREVIESLVDFIKENNMWSSYIAKMEDEGYTIVPNNYFPSYINVEK